LPLEKTTEHLREDDFDDLALKRARTVARSGRRLPPSKPAGKIRGTKNVAELIIAKRE